MFGVFSSHNARESAKETAKFGIEKSVSLRVWTRKGRQWFFTSKNKREIVFFWVDPRISELKIHSRQNGWNLERASRTAGSWNSYNYVIMSNKMPSQSIYRWKLCIIIRVTGSFEFFRSAINSYCLRERMVICCACVCATVKG